MFDYFNFGLLSQSCFSCQTEISHLFSSFMCGVNISLIYMFIDVIGIEPEVMFYWQSGVSFLLPYVGSFRLAHDFHLLESKA